MPHIGPLWDIATNVCNTPSGRRAPASVVPAIQICTRCLWLIVVDVVIPSEPTTLSAMLFKSIQRMCVEGCPMCPHLWYQISIIFRLCYLWSRSGKMSEAVYFWESLWDARVRGYRSQEFLFALNNAQIPNILAQVEWVCDKAITYIFTSLRSTFLSTT